MTAASPPSLARASWPVGFRVRDDRVRVRVRVESELDGLCFPPPCACVLACRVGSWVRQARINIKGSTSIQGGDAEECQRTVAQKRCCRCVRRLHACMYIEACMYVYRGVPAYGSPEEML